MNDTSTREGREKRLGEIVHGYMESGNWRGLVRVAGLGDSDRDYIPGQDDGEPPQGAKWE
jgi:hypothetical protein